MKIALVYDRINKWGGAERVLLALHELFPKAPLFTAVYSPDKAKWAKIFPKVITSFLQHIPYFQDKHELLGTFTPIAFEQLDFSSYDLVISVTSEAAKGILTGPKTRHLCYMLTPTRYLWSGYDLYFRNFFLRKISRPIINYLKRWDRLASVRPDKIIAISSEVQKRVELYYGRPSQIIFPPVNLPKKVKETRQGNFFLVVSRVVPYKRVDLAVRAFNKLGLPLYIVGGGSQTWKLKLMAKKNIKFLGEISDRKLDYYYNHCQALIFPQEEDFGITAVEAQAHGAPVIAFKAGGALDTMVDGVTGIFFSKQEVDSLVSAVAQFKRAGFSRSRLVESAKRFSKARFKKEFKKIVYGDTK
jgi:glycosyltransferase involved in cell wall biosynthesis